MTDKLPEEKIERLRELCRKHRGIELTSDEAAELGAYIVQWIRAVQDL